MTQKTSPSQNVNLKVQQELFVNIIVSKKVTKIVFFLNFFQSLSIKIKKIIKCNVGKWQICKQ